MSSKNEEGIIVFGSSRNTGTNFLNILDISIWKWNSKSSPILLNHLEFPNVNEDEFQQMDWACSTLFVSHSESPSFKSFHVGPEGVGKSVFSCNW